MNTFLVIQFLLLLLSTAVVFFIVFAIWQFAKPSSPLKLFNLTPIAYHLLVDSMEEGIIVLDRQNRVVSINPSATQMTPQPNGQLVGQWIDAVWPELAHEINANHNKVFELEPVVPERPYHEVSASPLYDRHGNMEGQLLTVRDITARKERELLQQDMTRSMVHDLRAPISNSLFALEMLKTAVSDFVSPDDRILLDMTYTNTEKTLQLVNQILDIHRLESGKIPLSLSRVPLANIIQDVLTTQHNRTIEKNIRIHRALPDTLPPAWADATLLARILQNLIDNAIKYSPQNGTIHISAKVTPGEPNAATQRLLISITDEGPGIPHTLQPHIFEKYVTGEDAGSGSGLGLPFCQMVLAAHGERIWVDSTPGQGTTFTFTLSAPA
ncbi:MAG: PAS domain-containing sensor histidine kinase [Ardenticatenaceae bacterium]|nr:PAS domain-containing sensor histidine kinase [Anaerolineales bacterium]MCB8921453.1 PAS domain-containing sensor histidine kinase [Ardenticatenaceae bacterium]MCB8991570.1 PAS domain-containing sensor histidine kinase [Ardenticatenaceae bacterium]